MPGRLREERGQATVEFALVLPLLVLCAAVLLHLGAALVVQLQLEHAAREGARAAAVEPDRAAGAASAAVAQVIDRPTSVATQLGAEFVIVRIETELALLPVLGAGGSRTLEADATMRREDLING
jgi:Flp pilus assembly protein TadG